MALSFLWQRLQHHPLFARLARNIGWNLLGQLAPLIAALLTMPPLIAAAGKERFGMLAIGWMLIGYFSLFDFGLGRALTQALAQKLAQKAEVEKQAQQQWQQECQSLIGSALALMSVLGLVAGLALYLLQDWMVGQALNVPPGMQDEARAGIWWLALALPSVVLATGLRGVLEAHQAFKMLNLVRTPLGVLTFAGPLAVLPFCAPEQQLPAMFAVLCGLRVLTLVLFLLACQKVQTGFWQMRLERSLIPALLRFGGWMTVSNIVGPLMVNMDRFLIGAQLSLVAVTWYTTPFEMMSRMLVLPGAVAGVCFPLFAQHWQQGNLTQMRQVFWKSTYALAALMGGLALVLIVCARPVLEWWLGAEFAVHSTTVLQLLALGVVINGLAHIPFALVQGMGAARVTAMFHLLELLCYLPMLYFFLRWWGINGVALAWVLRVLLDAVLLFVWSARHLRQTPQSG